MRTRFYFFMLTACAVIAGCKNKETSAIKHADTAKAPAVMAPFKYHKLMEVSPGQYYDVLSWGRGATTKSTFLILHSDSTGNKYTTTTGDLDGTIVDVYNADMDVDGNPEILIQAKSADTTKYTNIYAFEFNNNKAQQLDFPKLNSSKKNYRGGDNFYIQEGKLIREFPSYTGTGKDAKLTGGKYKLEYGLSDNNFTINTLVKDSTQVADDKPVVKQQTQDKPKVKKTEKKKKTETKKKKRRRN